VNALNSKLQLSRPHKQCDMANADFFA